MKTHAKSLSIRTLLLALAMSLLIGCAAPMVPASAPASDSAAMPPETAAEESMEMEMPVAADLRSGPAASPASPSRRHDGEHDRPLRDRRQEPITAGVVDDNEQWLSYLNYRERHSHVRAAHVDVLERYLIQVLDEIGAPVHDATVEVYLDKKMTFEGRTDAGGRLFFHPRALAQQGQQQQFLEYRVVASKGWVASSQTFPRHQNEEWNLTLDEPQGRDIAQLDLLFLIDATGSMDDEIAKLKASMADVADQIDLLPEAPHVRYGLVAYRDLDDAYVVQEYNFTADLHRFQRNLARIRAQGGGDEPESLNEALNRAIHGMSWRPEETVRMVVLVADAPPHLDYHWQPYSYETDMVEAVRKGIKLFPVGASGLNEDGEYIFRQLAQFTGGKFVFLTYEDGRNPRSGPGTETEHDVDNYSVNTLDRLIVRLVREELAMLPQMAQRRRPAQTISPLNVVSGQCPKLKLCGYQGRPIKGNLQPMPS